VSNIPPPPRRQQPSRPRLLSGESTPRFAAVNPAKIPDAIVDLRSDIDVMGARLDRHREDIDAGKVATSKLDANLDELVKLMHGQELKRAQDHADLKLSVATEVSKFRGAVGLAMFLIPVLVAIVVGVFRYLGK
jgi:hypothetical protein